MSKRFVVAFLLLTMLVTSLAGCAQTAEPVAEEPAAPPATEAPEVVATEEVVEIEPTGEEVVINYPTFQIGVNTAAKVVETLVNEFNAEYAGKYKIVVEEIPGDANYADKMKVLMASGELPPVVYGGGYKLLDMALEKDLVVDITEYVNADPEWLKLYDEKAMKVNARDGKIYASSQEGQLIGYFYNKDLFAQAGIETPATTWDQYFADLDTIKAAGITPLAMDTNGGAWVTQLLMGAMIATSGEQGLEFMNTVYPTDYCIEPITTAAAKIQELFLGYTTLDAVGGGYENAANNFFTGNVAIINNGPWMIGDFSDTTKTEEGFADKVGAAVYPGGFVYSDPIEGFFVTKQDDPALVEASIAMVKFFTSAHAQQLALEMQGMLPASPAVEITESAKTNFPLLAEFLDLAATATVRSSTFTSGMLPGVEDVMSREMQSLATGAITPDEFCQALSTAAEAAK